MPPKYTVITLREIKTMLETMGFEYYNDPNATEYVFQKYLDRSGKLYTLKLYTSVSKYTDDSRDVGTDAIRLIVCSNGKYFGEGRTNRTQNWKTNLITRIMQWDNLFKICPQCNNPLKERTGKFGVFYGCSTYPSCGFTERKI